MYMYVCTVVYMYICMYVLRKYDSSTTNGHTVTLYVCMYVYMCILKRMDVRKGTGSIRVGNIISYISYQCLMYVCMYVCMYVQNVCAQFVSLMCVCMSEYT